MERRHIPDTENKLVLLYALHMLGPVTDLQLNQFLAETDLMNYITMQLSLAEMQEQGQITRRAHPLGDLIEPTEDGLFTLNSFSGRIPRSRRGSIDRSASQWRERFRMEQMTPAEILERSGSGLMIRLRLLEDASVLLDLRLWGGDLPEAYLERRWQQAAQPVYRQMIAALTDRFAEDAPVPSGDQPGLQQAGTAEWMLSLQAEGFAALLVLPDEHLARYCLGRWEDCAPALRRSVVEALSSAAV